MTVPPTPTQLLETHLYKKFRSLDNKEYIKHALKILEKKKKKKKKKKKSLLYIICALNGKTNSVMTVEPGQAKLILLDFIRNWKPKLA